MPNEGMNRRGPSCDEYETPDWLYQALDTEFNFTMDGAARVEPTVVLVGKERKELRLENSNAKCAKYSANGRTVSWSGERVFCNPPYSNIDPFIEMSRPAALAVFLLPTATDNEWFPMLRWYEGRGLAELRYFRKRIKFCLNGKPTDSPRFTSLVAIVRL